MCDGDAAILSARRRRRQTESTENRGRQCTHFSSQQHRSSVEFAEAPRVLGEQVHAAQVKGRRTDGKVAHQLSVCAVSPVGCRFGNALLGPVETGWDFLLSARLPSRSLPIWSPARDVTQPEVPGPPEPSLYHWNSKWKTDFMSTLNSH